MKLARTLSSLCVACVLAQFIGAAPATQPGAPLTETDQLKQRIAQLEAEVADLRAKLERASKPDAEKGLTFKDELKLDVLPPPTQPGRIIVGTTSGTLTVGSGTRIIKAGSVTNEATMPSQRKILERPPGDLIDDRSAPQKP